MNVHIRAVNTNTAIQIQAAGVISGHCGAGPSRSRISCAVSRLRRSDDKLDRLRTHPLLGVLSAREIRQFGMYADPVRLAPGTLLMQDGRYTQHFYLFDDGALLSDAGVHMARCAALGFYECLTGRPASETVAVGVRCTGYALDGRYAPWLRTRLGWSAS